MASSGMLRRVALVRTDVSEELSASFIKVTRIGELGTALAVTSHRRENLKSYNFGIGKILFIDFDSRDCIRLTYSGRGVARVHFS
jgi:hypothetical protein